MRISGSFSKDCIPWPDMVKVTRRVRVRTGVAAFFRQNLATR